MSYTKQKVLSNFLWKMAERVGAQLVQFIVSIILARILAPEAYGTIALVTVFISILQVLIDSGLGNALIQKKNADNLDFSTVFFTNLIFCSFIYTILFACSPMISTFYNTPTLTPIIRVLGLTILISGVKNIQQAYVAKHMIFKKFFFATLAGTCIAAVVGIYMALHGYGVWALVAQQITNATIDTLVLWFTVKWRPKLFFSFKRLGGLFSYGWKLLASAFIDSVYNNIQQLLIGKFYSADDLAFYNRGRNLPELVIQNINTSIDSIMFPTMSNAQNDRSQVKRLAQHTIKLSTFVIAPFTFGIIFTASNLIPVLLTDKWLPCIPFLIIFAIAYTFWPIHTANLNAIKALGYSNIFLKLEIIKKTIGAVLLLISFTISPLAIAMGLLISDFFSLLVNAWPNRKLISYGFINQIKDILPTILLSLFMGMAVYCLNIFHLSNITTLILQIVSGIVIYVSGSKILKIDSYSYIISMIKQYLKKKRSSI